MIEEKDTGSEVQKFNTMRIDWNAGSTPTGIA